jgi:hypothetical protein
MNDRFHSGEAAAQPLPGPPTGWGGGVQRIVEALF